MSERPRAVSLANLGQGPIGFARDLRFTRNVAAARAPVVVEPEEPEDPVGNAWAEGYARGMGDAQEAAAQIIAEREAAATKIELSLARLDAAMQADLKDRLRETVEALCEAAIAPAALDPDGLTRRVECAAAMLARVQDERVIRLHPEDLALIAARLPEDWHFEPDATLDRGAVRVEGATGGVEDGPAQWRAAITEALRQC
ncbi:flagellar assembly protein FliH [Novosphingobium hassiacum]|uniref:Flagellar assembly protein FliH n=1 Tax=Novosphingobium hassiacum TaxID=173676 RepID=A0A7W5ZYH9_9SPHN|nr:FliH/SctL family protein [Novosphingobium hassiacum]MBB3861851.1 flagellar assembly protein FliH [Novosphingobium hassiacum]